MAKQGQKNFRLSAQAQLALDALTRFSGSNETAVVEQALVHYARQIISPRNLERLEVQMMGLPPLADDD